MKRILLLIDNMGQGGAERQMSYLAIGFKRKGYEVRLIKFFQGESVYKDDLDKANIKIEVAPCGTSKIKRPLYIAKVIRKWKPDKVIVYKDGACMAACIARMLTKFKLIVSERNTTQILSKRERIKFHLYRMADIVVPNSRSQANFLIKNTPWLKHKLCVITNTIDTEKFSPGIEKSEACHRIITTARIAPQKNILNYIEAIAILKKDGVKAHFDWYGRPEHQDYFDEIKNRVNQLELDDYITFHGGVSNIEECYRNATHFCLPSLYEGFPNVLCEAMASGLICTASNVCDNPYIIHDSNLLFDPEDPISIADTIKRSLDLSVEKQVKLRKANRDNIVNLCSAEAFITQYEAL